MAQLAFSKKFNEKMENFAGETHFAEKILNGLIKYGFKVPNKFLESDKIDGAVIPRVRPKIHTLRRVGAMNRKPGDKIHFTMNARTKNSFQFAPIVPIVKMDIVEVIYTQVKQGTESLKININGRLLGEVVISGGVLVQHSNSLRTFVQNDGFESVEHFMLWFNESAIYELTDWIGYDYFPNIKADEEE